VQTAKPVLQFVAVVNDGGRQPAASVVGRGMKLPEVHAQGLTPQPNMQPGCLASHYSNSFTSAALMEEKSGMQQESVASVPVSATVPESQSESEDVKAVPATLPVPESECESKDVEESAVPNSEPVTESKAVKESLIPVSVTASESEQAMEGSLHLPESELESEAVNVSTVPFPVLAALMENKSGMEEGRVSDGHIGPAVEFADRVDRELESSTVEPQEPFVSIQGRTLTEKTDSSSHVQHSSDANIPVHVSIASGIGTDLDANNEVAPCNSATVESLMEADAVEGFTVPFPALVPESEAVEESLLSANKPNTDAASEMGSVVEIQVAGHCTTNSPHATVTEPTENEVIEDKLQELIELEEFKTGMSEVFGECSDGEMKRHSDAAAVEPSSNQDKLLVAEELPGEKIDLNSVSECVAVDSDKGKQLVDESDSKESHVEVTYVRNVHTVDVSNEVGCDLIEETKDLPSAAVECDKEDKFVDESNITTSRTEVSHAGIVQPGTSVCVSGETELSLVIADTVQEAKDPAYTVEACKSKFTVVKCVKELEESVNAFDTPASDMEGARSLNVEAQKDSLNGIALSISSDEASVEVGENGESNCMTVVHDKDEELVDECDKTAVFTEVNYTGEVQAEATVEVVSCDASANEVTEAETVENTVQKPEELSLPQPAENTPNGMMEGEFLKMEDQHAADFGLSTDVALSCAVMHAIEVHSNGDERQSVVTDTVLKHSLELEKQTDNVEPVVDAIESLNQIDDSMIEHDGNTLKESDNCNSAMPHESEHLEQPPRGDERTSHVKMVAGDIEWTVTDSFTNPDDDIHLEAAVDCTAYDGQINSADEVASATASDLSPVAATETVTVAGLQCCESAVAKADESVMDIPVSVLIPVSESESEHVNAVSVSLPYPEFESEVVEVSTAPISEPEPELKAMEEPMIPVSVTAAECEQAMEGSVLPVSSSGPRCELESITVNVSTVSVSARVTELATVEGSAVPVRDCVLESDVAVEFNELDPLNDRSGVNELELMLHKEKEVMTASDSDVAASATDAGFPLKDVQMECDKHASRDGSTVTPNGDLDAVDQLEKQGLDSNTMAAVSNNIEVSEIEAQSVLCHHEPNMCCLDPSAPADVCAVSSENVSQHTDSIPLMAEDKGALPVLESDDTVQHEVMISAADANIASSEDTVQSEMMISTRDGNAEISVDSTVVSCAVVVTDVLENACISEHTVRSPDKDADENATSLKGNTPGRVIAYIEDEGALIKDSAISAKGQEDVVQSVPVISTAVNNTPFNTVSCSDMIGNEDTTEPVVSSDIVTEDAVLFSTAADRDTAWCPDNLESTIQSRSMISVIDQGTAVPRSVTDTVLISTDDQDLPVGAVVSENIKHSQITPCMADDSSTVTAVDLVDAVQSIDAIATADNDVDLQVESSADPVQSEVLVSATDFGTALTVASSQDTSQNGVMVVTTDKDVTMVTVAVPPLSEENSSCIADFSTVTSCQLHAVPASVVDPLLNSVVSLQSESERCNFEMRAVESDTADTLTADVVQQNMALALTDVSTAVNQLQEGDNMVDSRSRFDSQTSSGSVEEGQFDDVSSDDNIEPATPSSSRWQVYHASPTLRSGCHIGGRTSSLVSNTYRRNLSPVSPSLFSRSLATTPTSRHSSGMFAATNCNTMSAVAGQMTKHTPLLSSPVGQNIDGPGTRPRFPQSPITLQSGTHSSFHVRTNSPVVVRNVALSPSDEKVRKRKHSADDTEVSSKRILVADFAGDNTTVVSQCDVLLAESAIISSGCDNDNVTVTSTAFVGTLTQTAVDAAEMNQDGNGVGNLNALSQPVKSLPCDDCPTFMSEVAAYIEGSAHIESHGSVVDNSIPPYEQDMAAIDSCLLNTESVNSHAVGRPSLVEDIVKDFASIDSNMPVDTEVVESMKTNAEECMTINSDNVNALSQVDDVQPRSVTSVAEPAQTVYCSQPSSSTNLVENDVVGVFADNAGYNREGAADGLNVIGSTSNTDGSADKDMDVICCSSTGTEVGCAVDALTTQVVAGTSHDQCIGDFADKNDELLIHELTSEVQSCSSGITASVESSSLDPLLLTARAHTDSVDPVTDVTRSDNEMLDKLTADIQKACTGAVLPLSEDHCSYTAASSTVKSSQLQEDLQCVVDTLSNNGVSLESESEMRAAESDIAAVLTADGSFVSQCASQATDNEISAFQSTDVCDVFPSQCISQAAKSETLNSGSQVNNSPDDDGLKLYLELSQEPSTLGTSFCSQYMSQAAKNEGSISCSQMSCSSDADRLHLYLEPSQDRSSYLDTIDHRKWNFTKDTKLLDMEDEVSTEGEDSLVTVGEAEILTELRRRRISSQSTAGGLETTGEMEDADLESDEDNRHDRTLSCCQESGGVIDKMTSGTDSTCLETGSTLESVSIQSDVTDIPCESAVLNLYENVEEFCTSEMHTLSVIAEEEEGCDRNWTESLSNNDDVASKIDNRSESGAIQDAEVTLMAVTACLPVKYDAGVVAAVGAAADGEENCNSTGDDDALDVTESMSGVDSSIDKDVDVSESSVKATVCLSLQKEKSDVHSDADTKDHSSNEDAGMIDSAPGCDNNSNRDVDVGQLCKKAVYLPAVSADSASDIHEDSTAAVGVTGSTSNSGGIADNPVDVLRPSNNIAVYLTVKSDACITATDTGDSSDSDDDDNDDTNGLGVTGGASNIDGSADKDTDVIRPSDESAICSAEKSDDRIAAADVGDPSDDNDDDDNLDVTASISDAGSDIGHPSDSEENVPGRNDSVAAVSAQARQPQLTEHPYAVGNEQPEEFSAGKYCLIMFQCILPSNT